jgi:hypothetical protein
MASQIRVSVIVEIDDVPVANFPLYYRQAPSAVQTLVDTQATGGGFVAVPSSAMTTIQTAIFQTDQTLSVAFNGVVASPITLSAGGVLAVLGTSLTALSASNASGSTANLRGFIAGV